MLLDCVTKKAAGSELAVLGPFPPERCLRGEQQPYRVGAALLEM